MKRFMFIFLLIVIPNIAQSDDTIHCPTDPGALQANCNRVSEAIRYYEPQLNRSEQTLRNPNNYFFVSDKTGYYRFDGTWVNFGWTYVDKALNKRYVAMNRQQLTDYMRCTYRGQWYPRYREAINRSHQRRNELLSSGGTYEKWKHYIQQLYLFRAQCCGGRWKNDVGIQPPNQMRRQGGGTQTQPDGLLGVPFK